MASRIQTFLDQILNAVYGEEVRGSIHDAIQECYSDVSTAKTICEDATSAANIAASNANSEASTAQNAATKANNAAADANQAIVEADEATDNANAAAASANSAAFAANKAKNDADIAADGANTAASNANSKAILANDAAKAADASADMANQARANADVATSNANTATNSANNAAANANTAANNANGKADLAATAAQNANEKAVTADLAAANANNAASIANTSAISATNAADAANQAKTSADAATYKANDAATSATNAANSANSAATNANNAASDAMIAITETQTATYNANVAAQNVTKAVTRANTAAEMIEGITVDSEDVGPNGVANASVSVVSGHKHIHFVLKQGATGAPYIIKGNVFPTVGALEESITNPSMGDQYNVGSEPPYNIYRWTGTTWENQGKIGISISELSNSEIDTIWNGTAITSSTRKYLDHNGVFHLIVDKIKAMFNTKVDKVEGMGLSHNDFADKYIAQLGNHETQLEILANSKVDKITGKGLSTNDFTTAYKDQIDQNKIDIAGLSSSKVDKMDGKGLSTNDFTTAYKDQIDQNKTDITEVTKLITEIGADDIGAVPSTRKVNEKMLSEDISLTAEDVGALPLQGTASSATKLESKRKFLVDLSSLDKANFDGTEDVLMGVTGTLPIESGGTGATNAEQALLALGAVSRVNKKSADETGEITLSCEDIGAVPSTRKVNEKMLSEDISLTAEDVGAVPTAGMVTLTDSYTLQASDNGKIFYCNGGEGYAGNMYLYIASKPTQDMEFRILTDEYTTALVMPSDFEIDTGTWISTARHGSRAVFAGRTGRVTYSANAETWVFENDSVWEDKLMQSCVEQYHLAESAVSTSKLELGAVTEEKIRDAAVTPAKLDRAYATLNDADKVTPEQASASIVNKTASFTLSLADAGTWIYSSVTSAITITVPTNTAVHIPIGTEIEFCQFNTGSVTFAAASGVTLVSLDSKKKIAGRYGCAALKKTATNTWILAGALS